MFNSLALTCYHSRGHFGHCYLRWQGNRQPPEVSPEHGRRLAPKFLPVLHRPLLGRNMASEGKVTVGSGTYLPAHVSKALTTSLYQNLPGFVGFFKKTITQKGFALKCWLSPSLRKRMSSTWMEEWLHLCPGSLYVTFLREQPLLF